MSPLDEKFVPTPLVEPSNRMPIEIEWASPAISLRGMYVLMHVASLLSKLAWLKVRGKLTDRKLGQVLSSFFDRMGALWIKLAQLLSMRAEFLPSATCDELATLQDRAKGFSPDAARQLVESELGEPIDRLFSEFDGMPFAAASLAQVHRARLRHNGALVAVKVQRPDVARTFRKDLLLIRGVTRLFSLLHFRTHFHWKDLLWELEQFMSEEIDYRFEATNMRRMRRSLRPHGIYVPIVFRGFSTSRVLVMEYLRGVLSSDYLKVRHTNPRQADEWLERNNIEPKKVAAKLVYSHLRQALEDNLFHGDLHPGNIMLLRDSRVAFLDFGTVGHCELDFLRRYDLYLESMATKNFSKTVDLFLLLAEKLPAANLQELKDKMIRLLQSWEIRCRVLSLPYRDRSVSVINDKNVRLSAQYGVAPFWALLRLIRAWYTMDATVREMKPEMDVFTVLNRYRQMRGTRLRRHIKEVVRPSAKDVNFALGLPSLLADDAVYRDTVLRRAAQVYESANSKMGVAAAFTSSLLSKGLAIAALLIVCLLIHQRLPEVIPGFARGTFRKWFGSIPSIDFQVWLIVFLVLFRSLWAITRLRREFADADIPVS